MDDDGPCSTVCSSALSFFSVSGWERRWKTATQSAQAVVRVPAKITICPSCARRASDFSSAGRSLL